VAAAAAAVIPELKPVKSYASDTAPVVVPDVVDDDLADKSDFVKARVMERRTAQAAKQAALVKEADEREAAAKREQVEREAARLAHGQAIKEWAEEAPSGTKKNIRVLLSTLPAVLWADAKWEPVPMAKLIDAKRVRLSFLKACTLVHPDKHNAMSAEHKFIAGEVFNFLEAAFRTFEAAEL